jgi:YfiH family protein
VFFRRDQFGDVEIAITDGSVDLLDPADLASVAAALQIDAVASMRQVHGAEVAWVEDASMPPTADALATDVRGLGVLARVADCVPVALASPAAGVVAAVHVGRRGLLEGAVPAAVSALHSRGAAEMEAWIGPHICGRCYELPAEMADAVAEAVPQARSVTSWDTPAADLGEGVRAQLEATGAIVHDVSACTLEDEGFFAHRRGDTGRFGLVAVLR